MDIWDANDAAAQEFYIDQTRDGQYKIALSSLPDCVLTCKNTGTSGSPVTLEPYKNTANQLWTFEAVKDPPGYDTELISAQLNDLINGDHPVAKELTSGFVYDANGNAAWGCYGFARLVEERIFHDTVEWRLTEPRTNTVVLGQLSRGEYSRENVTALMNQAIPGDIIQFDGPENHAIVYLWRDENRFGVYDANWGNSYNVVNIHSFSYSGLQNKNTDHITLFRYTGYPTAQE